VPEDPPVVSARRPQLLEAAYDYALSYGLADLSLRPLAAAIGSSPRVLLYLFGDKDGLVRALLARARSDELALLQRLQATSRAPLGLVSAAEETWRWLSAPAHRPLLVLWAEAYTHSLVDPDGPWSGFARSTVHDWLDVLADAQTSAERRTKLGERRRTLALAALRGALLDLLATGERERVDAAIRLQLGLLDRGRRR
jgi:AcrR family transcriptional regulator